MIHNHPENMNDPMDIILDLKFSFYTKACPVIYITCPTEKENPHNGLGNT
jgi:hypothetical protein